MHTECHSTLATEEEESEILVDTFTCTYVCTKSTRTVRIVYMCIHPTTPTPPADLPRSSRIRILYLPFVSHRCSLYVDYRLSIQGYICTYIHTPPISTLVPNPHLQLPSVSSRRPSRPSPPSTSISTPTPPQWIPHWQQWGHVSMYSKSAHSVLSSPSLSHTYPRFRTSPMLHAGACDPAVWCDLTPSRPRADRVIGVYDDLERLGICSMGSRSDPDFRGGRGGLLCVYVLGDPGSARRWGFG